MSKKSRKSVKIATNVEEIDVNSVQAKTPLKAYNQNNEVSEKGVSSSRQSNVGEFKI